MPTITQDPAATAAQDKTALATTSGEQLTSQIAAPPATTDDVDAARAVVNQGGTVRASWKFALDTMRGNMAYMSPEARDLLVWIFTWCIDPAHSIHFDAACDRLGFSANTLYKLYAGKYRHPDTNKLMDAPEKLVRAIREFRRLELLRAKMGRKQFVMTPTAKRIFWAIEQSRKSGCPLMIRGGSQIGKTEAYRQNCIDFNHGKTILVEIEAVNGLLQAIAAKLGVSINANTPDLIARIKKALTSDMVVIFDEVHLLANVYRRQSFFACMEETRRIWDAVKCGMVFSYTDLGYAAAEAERKRELVQIFRRAGFDEGINLGPSPLLGDVKAIVESYGLDWSERNEIVTVAKGVQDTPQQCLRFLAEERGLKAIIERVRLAHELAADDSRDEIDWTDFIKAHFAVKAQGQAPKSGWDEKGVAA